MFRLVVSHHHDPNANLRRSWNSRYELTFQAAVRRDHGQRALPSAISVRRVHTGSELFDTTTGTLAAVSTAECHSSLTMHSARATTINSDELECFRRPFSFAAEHTQSGQWPGADQPVRTANTWSGQSTVFPGLLELQASSQLPPLCLYRPEKGKPDGLSAQHVRFLHP